MNCIRINSVFLALLLTACAGEEFTAGTPDGGADSGPDTSTGGGSGVGGSTTEGGAGTGNSAGAAATGGSSTGGKAGTGGEAGSAGSSTGGMAGVGGAAGTGGNAGAGGTAGSGGIAGAGGLAGSGGTGGSPPCETGIYLTIDNQASGGNVSSSAGPLASTTYNVHGTSAGNKLSVTVTLVNNLAGDFTMPQSTNALEAVRIRCQDPAGGSSFTLACDLPLVSGQASCVPDCYSLVGGTVKMQLQVNPVAAGLARIGINPNSVKICDDQTGNPVWNVQ